jgi:endonuclease YncB( thermonuclease family)
MRVALLVVAVLAVSTAEARSKKKKGPSQKHDAQGFVMLNGEETEVKWTDGDSFKIKSGQYKGSGTRLQRYNTLEAYGPVHQWGTWTPQELYEIAKGSSQVAAEEKWVCTTDGKLDGYKRLLVDCPELAVHMARRGVGMAYAVDGLEPDPKVLAAQKEAIQAKVGLWEKGVAHGVITSLHSVGEDGPGDTKAYNRVVDTRTGKALKREHKDTYATCQNVCVETDGQQSCMIYVPFKQRYGKKPECLKSN